MLEKKLVPKLRFAEFVGEWNTIKVGEIGKPSMCKRIMKDQTLSDGDIPFYKIGTFGKEADAYISNDLYVKYKAKFSFPQKGDVLISASGTIGRTVIYDGRPAFFQDSNIVWIANNEEKVLNTLLVYAYENVRWTTENTTIARLYNDNLKNISIAIPQLPEQQKIASFLTEIDTKLSQLTKKKALLENYKKGVMQQIFSQQLRFKDGNGNDYGDWHSSNIGNVFKSLKGKGIPKGDVINDGANKCVLYGELYTTYNEIISNVVSSTNSIDGLKSKKGDMLMPSSTTTTGIDLANVTALNFDNVSLGGDIIVLRAKKEINNVFYAYYLSNHKKYEIASRAQGITIVHIYFNSIKDLNIDVPSLKEQTKIANFLSDLDTKIEVLSTSIENTQTFKKGLLQQLFV